MYVLNYLYFLIITVLALQYLHRKGKKVINPLDEKQKIIFSGPELFWTLTFSTGLLAFSAPAGLDLMALRLFSLEGLCLLCLLSIKNRPVWSLPTLLYLAFLLWLAIGLLYTPSTTYGIRVILKYLYPLLILLTASAVVRSPEVFLKSAKGARLVAFISIIISFIPYLERSLFPGVIWYGTARAINYIAMCMFSLALFCLWSHKKKDFWYAVLFAIPCVLWVFRTSIMGTIAALMCFAFYKYRFKSLPIIAGILLLFVMAVFFIPSVKEKMFFDKKQADISQVRSGEISMDNINSNGRFAMWEWALGKFFEQNKLEGSGTGNLQETFYALRHPFGTIRICHNDYVQILCDNGLIGIILFGGSFLLMIGHGFVVFQNKKYSVFIRICAITAGTSMTGMLLTMYTDNVINYSMATLSYPCGFYGMMLGLIRGERSKNHAF